MRSEEIKRPALADPNSKEVSPIEIRQTANAFGAMAEDYLRAIGAAKAVTENADTRDMERKRRALLHGRKVLLAMLGVSE